MLEKLQINIEYSIFEDRLLMKVSGKEGHGGAVEYRLWFTRRFVGIFMGGTAKIIEDSLAGDAHILPDALEAMKKFQEEAALTKADFSTSYNPDSEELTLMGEIPLLISKMQVKKKSENKYILSFLTIENEGINITADIDLIHTLRKMFFDSFNNAGWNKNLSPAGEEKIKQQ